MAKPARCTDAMWWFWTEFQKLEPSCQLGGIYASKPGYHNYRDALPKTDYSVQLDADKLGPGDMAAAIDLTFPDAQSGRYATIIKYADRLLRSGHDPDDPRGNYLREFYGQADTDQGVEGWDFQYLVAVTSDSSHLWHLHLSFLRMFLNDWVAMDAVLSILEGETVAEWRARGGERVMYLVNVVDGTKNWVYVTDGVREFTYLNTDALKFWQGQGIKDLGNMTIQQAKDRLGVIAPPSTTPAPPVGAPVIDYTKLAQALLAQVCAGQK